MRKVRKPRWTLQALSTQVTEVQTFEESGKLHRIHTSVLFQAENLDTHRQWQGLSLVGGESPATEIGSIQSNTGFKSTSRPVEKMQLWATGS